MRNRLRGARFASAIAALITAFLLGVTPTASQAEAYKALRTVDGKPDLNGIWQALNTANWDIQEHAARPGLVVAVCCIECLPNAVQVRLAVRCT